jgi:hypothetical protein
VRINVRSGFAGGHEIFEGLSAATSSRNPWKSGKAFRRCEGPSISFVSARARGEDRVFVEGLWVEAPTDCNARKLFERAKKWLNGVVTEARPADKSRSPATARVARLPTHRPEAATQPK